MIIPLNLFFSNSGFASLNVGIYGFITLPFSIFKSISDNHIGLLSLSFDVSWK